MSCPADDCLDGLTLLGQRRDRSVCRFTTQIALVLQLLCARQQVRIDYRCPDRTSDRAHRFAHRVKKGRAGVLHQMPTICDLDGRWQRPCGSLAVPDATQDLVRGCSLGFTADAISGD
jgi:hypothetical protein